MGVSLIITWRMCRREKPNFYSKRSMSMSLFTTKPLTSHYQMRIWELVPKRWPVPNALSKA